MNFSIKDYWTNPYIKDYWRNLNGNFIFCVVLTVTEFSIITKPVLKKTFETIREMWVSYQEISVILKLNCESEAVF